MKAKYGWCVPFSDEAIAEIWKSGILTLDTNVLLDLYRYHDDTRAALLNALGNFENRSWISHQTAEEFFRNRRKVIVSASNSFNDADRQLSDIRVRASSSVESLKGNRIIPDSVAEKLGNDITAAIDAAEELVQTARGAYPNYLSEDPILQRLLDMFEGAVGDPFSDKEESEALKEGERRIKQSIPPGFLDSDKDGDRRFGDYFLWRQLLTYAKKKKKPVIFVTSERKEDWWEKVAGRFTGLQYALIKEMHDETGQPILAYRTDRFLEFTAKFSGEEADDSAVREIRDIAKARAAAVHTVQVISQKTDIAEPELNVGSLRVRVLRSTVNFTCSGRLEPRMTYAPKVSAQLVEHPEQLSGSVSHAGTGTNFDFNVHTKSAISGEMLPEGEYVFEYQAIASTFEGSDEDPED